MKKAHFRSVRGGGVRSSIDVGRLSSAVSRPGIDPRTWVTFAVVLDVAYDKDEGMYADVQLVPSGEKHTVIISSTYAGEGFGAFTPPNVNDLVLVAVPEGDFGVGPVLFARVHSTAPPPEFENADTAEETDATPNPTIVAEPQKTLRVVCRDGANLKIEVSGEGNVEVVATGSAQVKITGEAAVIVNSPDVRLGTDPANAVARVGDIVMSTIPPLLGNLGMPITPVPPVTITATGGIPAVGQIVSGQKSVKA